MNYLIQIEKSELTGSARGAIFLAGVGVLDGNTLRREYPEWFADGQQVRGPTFGELLRYWRETARAKVEETDAATARALVEAADGAVAFLAKRRNAAMAGQAPAPAREDWPAIVRQAYVRAVGRPEDWPPVENAPSTPAPIRDAEPRPKLRAFLTRKH